MEQSRLQLIGQFALVLFAAILLAIAGVLYIQAATSMVGIAVCLLLAIAALGCAVSAPARLHFKIAQWFLGW